VLAGRFVLGELLARGASGVVYEASDLERGEPAAVKMLPQAGGEPWARLQREFQALSRAKHPGLVRVHAIGQVDEGGAFLAMELLRGETLGALLRREKALPAGQALAVALRCAEAMQAAHEVGVIHRDLKPDNIFLCGAAEVRIVDFGLSTGASRLTCPGMAVGTAAYMAPEQILADPVDGRTDVYALGVVLFRSLAGHLPFQEQNSLSLMAHHLLRPVPALHLVHPCPDPCARGCAALIAAALRKCPERRLGSMVELARWLRCLLEGRPVPGGSPPGRDVYRPRGEFGRRVVGSFYHRLGLQLPAGVGESWEEG
jgi:serine/threonine-protein kinase